MKMAAAPTNIHRRRPAEAPSSGDIRDSNQVTPSPWIVSDPGGLAFTARIHTESVMVGLLGVFGAHLRPANRQFHLFQTATN
jgi:hypothetical protein